MTEQELYALLDDQGIPYEVSHHQAVMTVAEAAEVVPSRATPTKNLFLRDSRRREFFLVVADTNTTIDLKTLHHRLGTRRLSFANAEQLMEKLGLRQGSVTPFGILNDETRTVTLVFDETLAHKRIDAHPLVNTATMFVELDDVLPLFRTHGSPVRFCKLTGSVEPTQAN